MSIDVNSGTYRVFEEMIKQRRRNKEEWENLFWLDTNSEEEVVDTLNQISMIFHVEKITINDWKEIIENVKNDEEFGLDTYIVTPEVIIPRDSKNDKFQVFTNRGSAWSEYKKVLYLKGFEEDSIKMIQSSTTRILNKLSDNTVDDGIVKGLVIGNVQSGKTANMAALMSMAADNGFNMFIILSGTIENLRKQTQNRLIEDLKDANLTWKPYVNVDISPNYERRLSSIQVSPNASQRHFVVCLKNSTRLANLINWLDSDIATRKQLKILVIDDESDQAGVNTANIELDERSKINQLLVNLITNKNASGKESESKFRALNYIAYTATPYANILNETPGDNSTYPSNFVACLSVPNSYFGPQQIFGLEEKNMDGMDIVNIVDEDDVLALKDLEENELPESLIDAICWFCCTLSMRRAGNSHKPVSMLIHTSQKQNDHRLVYENIKNWFSKTKWEKFKNRCRAVYLEQTNKFSLEEFRQSYPKYSYVVDDYLDFDDMEMHLKEIYNTGLQSIEMNDDKSITFNKGIHLCIDNCAQKDFASENEVIRLIYPNDDSNLDFAPGFIVIGGATLSRGLTIEGLTTSYFLRTVKLADTLMQMGRWFGYRRGYELLQRLWMSEETKDKFYFLSELDYELRQEMKEMEFMGAVPGEVGIKVKTHSNKKFLCISAKNKTHDAVVADFDFSGMATQTTMFYEKEDDLESNYKATIEFVNTIGAPSDFSRNKKAINSIIWESVEDNYVLSYLKKMKFPRNSSKFFDLDLFCSSYRDIAKEHGFDKWNIVLSGVNDNDAVNKIEFGKYIVTTVNRSRKVNENDDKIIRIGALRSPKDLYIDINLDYLGLNDIDKEKIRTTNTSGFMEVRKHAGLDKRSLLIIYVIDHNSKKEENRNTTRADMNTKNDIVGLAIVIPNGNKNNKGEHLTIKLEFDEGED